MRCGPARKAIHSCTLRYVAHLHISCLRPSCLPPLGLRPLCLRPVLSALSCSQIGEEPGARHSGVTWLRQTSFDMAGLVHEAEQQQLRHSGARAHGVADGAGGGGGRGRQHRGTARGQQ